MQMCAHRWNILEPVTYSCLSVGIKALSCALPSPSSFCPLSLFSPPFYLPTHDAFAYRGWMLQTDVEVFGLVRLHAAQGHPRLPDELIMCQLVFVTHGHPGIERNRQAVRWGRLKWRKCHGERGKHELNMLL